MTTLDAVSFAPFLLENQHFLRFVLLYDAGCYYRPFNCWLSYFCIITFKNSKNIFQFNSIDLYTPRGTRFVNYVFDVLGFGSDPEAIDPNDSLWAPAEMMNGMYSESVALLVNRLGLILPAIFSTLRREPGDTWYCFPPVRIMA